MSKKIFIMSKGTVTYAKCLPQFCFLLFARNITETTKILFYGHAMHIYFLNFVSSKSTNRNIGKHGCQTWWSHLRHI